MEKILIVDDSALSRKVLTGILSEAGFSVIEAPDGMSAIEKYFIEKPDLVITDLLMEPMPGLEILKKIREMDKDACIIVATADIQDATKEEVMKEGAMAFINKPFKKETILDAVSKVLEGKKS